jgi:hypothetical protein
MSGCLEGVANGLDDFLSCRRVHPCFMILYLIIGLAGLSSGGLWIAYGSVNIWGPIMFGVCMALSLLVLCIQLCYGTRDYDEEEDEIPTSRAPIRSRSKSPRRIITTNPIDV